MILLTPTHLEPNLAIHILYPIPSVSFPYLPPSHNNLQVGMRVVHLEHERWQRFPDMTAKIPGPSIPPRRTHSRVTAKNTNTMLLLSP